MIIQFIRTYFDGGWREKKYLCICTLVVSNAEDSLHRIKIFKVSEEQLEKH